MKTAQETARGHIHQWITEPAASARAEVLNTLVQDVTAHGLVVMFHFGVELNALVQRAMDRGEIAAAKSYDLDEVTLALERDISGAVAQFDVVQPEGSDVLSFAAAH